MASAPPALSLPLMFGLPDDQMVRLDSLAKGPSFRVPGASSFLPYLSPANAARLQPVFFGPEIAVQPAAGMEGQPLVNNIADADLSAGSLRMLSAMAAALRSPCFNHPVAVLDSGRDQVAGKLARIEGLQVPRTIRARIDEPADIPRLMAEHGLEFPVLVRVAGTHGGLATVKVDGVAGLAAALRAIPWGGRELYLSQFIDYRDADDRYRKMRLVVVGQSVFLRHLISATEWLVHSQERDAAALTEETAALANFDTDLLPRIRGRVLAIADALGLDYFGIDCSLRPDGALLVFEANAAMNILFNSSPSPNCWDHPIQRIHDALASLLFDPARWRRGLA